MTLDIRIESAVLSFIFKKPERSDTTLRHSIFCGSTVLRFSFPRFFGSLFPWFYGSLFLRAGINHRPYYVLLCVSALACG
jgi:hypothetical protein